MSGVLEGDCLEVMAGMEPESVDAVVTDPPYGLGFMGKAWDHGAPGVPFWREMLRVAKPSSYLLAFGGTRTVHRIATSIEDAGWIIRDMLVWAYASGFPKSKASLKPAWEPIVMARKPGPLRMLAIDECRIPFRDAADAAVGFGESMAAGRTTEPVNFPTSYDKPEYVPGLGRWPANVILTDPIFDGDTEGVVGGGYQESTSVPGAWAPRGAFPIDNPTPTIYGDSGTYSRFFLIPKADRTDREPVLRGSLAPQDVFRGHQPDNPKCRTCGRQRIGPLGSPACECAEPDWAIVGDRQRENSHPTVKPTELMRHLGPPRNPARRHGPWTRSSEAEQPASPANSRASTGSGSKRNLSTPPSPAPVFRERSVGWG